MFHVAEGLDDGDIISQEGFTIEDNDYASDVYEKVIEATSKVLGNLLISAHISHFYANGVGYYFTFGGVAPKGKTDLEFYQECWNVTVKAVSVPGLILTQISDLAADAE